jgi:protein disulfide-isomerase
MAYVKNAEKRFSTAVKLTLFVFCFVFLCSLYSDDTIWLTDFKEAKLISQKRHLPILLNFTGSDWCPYCKKLENEVFSQPKFAAYVKENFVLLKIDFPQSHPIDSDILDKRKKLAEKYKIKEFPAVVFLSKDGDFILKSGYREGGVDSYIAFLKIVKKLAVSL